MFLKSVTSKLANAVTMNLPKHSEQWWYYYVGFSVFEDTVRFFFSILIPYSFLYFVFVVEAVQQVICGNLKIYDSL